MHQHVALRGDEKVSVTLTKDRRGLDVDGVVASHLIIEVKGGAYGCDNRPYGISAGAGAKGNNPSSNEEDTSFDLGTTVVTIFGEEGVKRRSWSQSLEEGCSKNFAFE